MWRARRVRYAKEQTVVHAGDATGRIWIVLTGRLHVVSYDYWGARSLLSEVGAGGIFGAAYALGHCDTFPLEVVCAEAACAVVLDIDSFNAAASLYPKVYSQCLANLACAVSDKSVALIHTLQQVKQRTLRQKLLSYLSYRAGMAGSNDFCIPLSRQQLADFLGVDRAALSRELSALQADGLVDYHKNNFTLHLLQ